MWWLQIPSDGHCWEVSERAWVADVTLVWGPGALETATGVTQQHREPGCFGRGGLYSSAPQMGLFPSPPAAIRAPCMAPVAGRALPRVGGSAGYGFALPPKLSRAPSPLPVSQGGRRKPAGAEMLPAPVSPQTSPASSPVPRLTQVSPLCPPCLGAPMGSAGKGDVLPSPASGADFARVRALLISRSSSRLHKQGLAQVAGEGALWEGDVVGRR